MDNIDPTTGEVMPGMAPALAASIVAVKKHIRQLGADSKNEHAKYAFVSVDKFYERIGPLMAEAGLALLMDEVAAEVKESGKSGNPWLFVQYDLRFVHESGAVSAPLHRSLALPINGPQTYGAAQSYIEKQFLRQVFKIPTGEKDADETAQNEDAPAGRSAGRTAQTSPSPSIQSSARAHAAPAPSPAKEEATKRWKELRNEIDASMTTMDLESIPGSLAWDALVASLHEIETKEVADNAMQQLLDRIEKRKALLLDGEKY